MNVEVGKTAGWGWGAGAGMVPGGVLPNILGGGVLHGSQNPDPISDQNV